jgi:glycine betaine/proline transport system substrate-binding protein
MHKGLRLYRSRPAALALALTLAAEPALATDPESCKSVRFADIGWTDIVATTAVASAVLEPLGYSPEAVFVSIPIAYASMRDGNIDVFLGDWQPSLAADRLPYLDDGSVTVLGPNLEGAKYTLAVPTYLSEAGLRDFADIAAFRDQLGNRIYGIEPGNDGNRIIQSLIDENAFGLSGFTLVESSEQGMLSQFARHYERQEPTVILAWAPHPMNARFDITYLSGGDDWFGENYGAATVYTNVRSALVDACPNLVRFLSQLRFSLEMENEIMGRILDDGQDPRAAAAEWLAANPDFVQPWLEGVSALDGGSGQKAFAASLRNEPG